MQLHNWLPAWLSYLKENYKIIAIDLSKQQVFDADPKAIQQINFIGNLEHAGNATFIIKKVKETVSNNPEIILNPFYEFHLFYFWY